jgi:hypothetical protein
MPVHIKATMLRLCVPEKYHTRYGNATQPYRNLPDEIILKILVEVLTEPNTIRPSQFPFVTSQNLAILKLVSRKFKDIAIEAFYSGNTFVVQWARCAKLPVDDKKKDKEDKDKEDKAKANKAKAVKEGLHFLCIPVEDIFNKFVHHDKQKWSMQRQGLHLWWPPRPSTWSFLRFLFVSLTFTIVQSRPRTVDSAVKALKRESQWIVLRVVANASRELDLRHVHVKFCVRNRLRCDESNEVERENIETRVVHLDAILKQLKVGVKAKEVDIEFKRLGTYKNEWVEGKIFEVLKRNVGAGRMLVGGKSV